MRPWRRVNTTRTGPSIGALTKNQRMDIAARATAPVLLSRPLSPAARTRAGEHERGKHNGILTQKLW